MAGEGFMIQGVAMKAFVKGWIWVHRSVCMGFYEWMYANFQKGTDMTM